MRADTRQHRFVISFGDVTVWHGGDTQANVHEWIHQSTLRADRIEGERFAELWRFLAGVD